MVIDHKIRCVRRGESAFIVKDHRPSHHGKSWRHSAIVSVKLLVHAHRITPETKCESGANGYESNAIALMLTRMTFGGLLYIDDIILSTSASLFDETP